MSILTSSPHQKPEIHSSLPPKPGQRWEGREQPKPDPSQRDQSLRSGSETVPRLVPSTVLQGQFRVPHCRSTDTQLTPVFALQAALFTAPYKSDVLRSLSKGQQVKEEDCLEKIRKFLINFTATVDVIYEMYSKMNADLDNRVWREEAHSCSRSLCISPFAFCSFCSLSDTHPHTCVHTNTHTHKGSFYQLP